LTAVGATTRRAAISKPASHGRSWTSARHTRPDKYPATFRAGGALAAGEAEQPGRHDRRACFLVHLPGSGLIPALAGLRTSGRKIPDRRQD
jgi:hypothetical protein